MLTSTIKFTTIGKANLFTFHLSQLGQGISPETNNYGVLVRFWQNMGKSPLVAHLLTAHGSHVEGTCSIVNVSLCNYTHQHTALLGMGFTEAQAYAILARGSEELGEEQGESFELFLNALTGDDYTDLADAVVGGKRIATTEVALRIMAKAMPQADLSRYTNISVTMVDDEGKRNWVSVQPQKKTMRSFAPIWSNSFPQLAADVVVYW